MTRQSIEGNLGTVEKVYTYSCCCILLSGGVGSRMNESTPKQYLPVAGRTVIEHTMYAIRNWKPLDSLIVVADSHWQDYLSPLIAKVFPPERVSFLGFSRPGVNRQMSVLNALQDISPYMRDRACVMIHDAVRPLVSESLIMTCNASLSDSDGVMPFLPMKDTVYESTDGRYISKNLDRSMLIAGQTPEFYDYHKYLTANEALSEDELATVHGSSEPAVKAGMKIALVPGEESNFKITTREDLERFKRMYEARQ